MEHDQPPLSTRDHLALRSEAGLLAPGLPVAAPSREVSVACCGWPIRSQWRVRAGLAPASLRHRPFDAEEHIPAPRVRASEPFAAAVRTSAYEPKRIRSPQEEAPRRIRSRPLPACLQAPGPERARLARHPEPPAFRRRRDVDALHDGHRDPHGDLSP